MKETDDTPMGGETAAEALSLVPWVRGWGGQTEIWPWSTVGTGFYLSRVGELRGSVETGDLDAEWQGWQRHFGQEFIDYVKDETFTYYRCPRCQATI
jgi:hypothetical protein